MGEKLGEAVLELRTDDSNLVSGMAKAKAGAQDLDRAFASSGRNASTSLAGLTSSTKATGLAASAMAVQAQMSARSAVGLATGATTATVAVNGLGHGSALATRELLVLMREASRGNFTRMAGSATILTTALQGSGQSVKGLVANLLTMFGLLKTTTDAELAAEAAAAGANAAAVGSAAAIAAAKVTAADVEIALAQAQVKAATTSEAEAAAQVRLAAAHELVAAAAEQARIAELALAAAQGRAIETERAAASTTVTSLTRGGMVITGALTGTAIAAGLLYTTFKVFQDQVRDHGTLDAYANSLGLTKKEMKELRQEVGGLSSKEMKDLDARARAFQITWGDVFHGLAKTTSDALDLSPAWNKFKADAESGWIAVLKSGANAAARLYGLWTGTYRTLVQTFGGFANAIGSAFVGAVNAAINQINKLLSAATSGINGLIGGVNSHLGTHIGTVSAPQLANITDSYSKAGKAAGKSFAQNVSEATAFAQKQIASQVATIWGNIIGAAEKRIKDAADTIVEDRTPKKAKKPKKVSDHGLAEALAELDAQIRGQYQLAAAYQVSDAAAVEAEALQKAEEDAIKHKSQVGVFYEKELQKAVATRAAEGGKIIADLRFEADTRQLVNDQMAAGTETSKEANQQLQLETELRPQVTALTVLQGQITETQAALITAEGAAKQALLAKLASEIVRREILLGVIRGITKAQGDLNAQLARTQQLQDIEANKEELDRLRLEASLIGASNRERAVAIAQLEAEQRLKTMPGLTSAEQQAYIQSFKDKANASVVSPFQQWAKDIPQDRDAINEALQGIEVKGLDGLASAITGIITGTESLKTAFHNLAASILADLIQMTIKMLIFKALQAAFGGSFTGGGGVPGFSGGHALGGLIPAGTFGIVGEKGPEPIIATPKGAMVLPNSTLRKGFGAANDHAPRVSVTNYNDFRGADPAAVAAINGRVDQMEQDLPGRVVSTMFDARSRFVWR